MAATTKKVSDIPGFWDRAERIDSLEKLVLANGQPGSELVKAFALHGVMGDLDLSNDADAMRLKKATDEAMGEWDKLTTKEQVHILGGWYPANELPMVDEFIQGLSGYSDNMMFWMLMAMVRHDGKVDFWGEAMLVHDIAQVQVAIRQGTTKAEALEQLRRITAALEENWEAAIALDGHKGITTEAKEEKFSVGDMVIDTGANYAAGIIVGGFQGVNGWAYTYLNAMGEVDVQFANSLKRAPGSKGGLPDVTDLSGGDPLERLRKAGATAA